MLDISQLGKQFLIKKNKKLYVGRNYINKDVYEISIYLSKKMESFYRLKKFNFKNKELFGQIFIKKKRVKKLTIDDIKVTAFYLKKIHNYLRFYKKRKLYKKNTIKKLHELEKCRKNFIKEKKNIELKNTLKKKILKCLNKNILNYFKKLNPNQIIHGDLHIRNVIYKKKKVFFIDFEDLIYFNAKYDIASFLQSLNNIIFQPTNLKYDDIFLKTYGYKNLEKIKKELSTYLKFKKMYCILILIKKLLKTKRINKKELNKFLSY